MPLQPLATSKIDDETQADLYLNSLLENPDNRTMDVVRRHAQMSTNDDRFRTYFIDRAKMILRGFGEPIGE